MNQGEIKTITQAAFEKYGTVIELKPHSQDGWEIVVKVEDTGWRIAVLEFSRKAAKVLENHPTSKESFEPMQGVALLMVAENGDPENFETFLLDQPVCLHEGVWHQVISLSEVSRVKITENLEVSCEYHQLNGEVRPYIIY